MKKLFYIGILLIADSALVKDVFIDVYNDPETYKSDSGTHEYRVDFKLKLWKFKNHVFRDFSLSHKIYDLVEEGKDGRFFRLDEDLKIGDYGDSLEGGIHLFIIPKKYISKKRSGYKNGD